MPFSSAAPWLEQFVWSATMIRAGTATAFYRSVRSGNYVRLASGVFLPTRVWASMHPDDQFRARVHAVAAASRPGLVFSHLSAAALWRLPMVGVWPAKPEVTVGTAAVGATRRAYSARKYPIPHPEVIDGVAVTGLARTVVDVARTSLLSTSVAMMDRAIAATARDESGPLAQRTGKQELHAELEKVSNARGGRRCALAVSLADGASGSAGESLSRVGIFSLGLPAPALQKDFSDGDGLIGYVDFWWPEFDLIGEFDGHGKYLREELLAGCTTAEVVLAEKVREDRLRALGHRLTRWGWSTARSLPRLRGHLEAAGLHAVR